MIRKTKMYSFITNETIFRFDLCYLEEGKSKFLTLSSTEDNEAECIKKILDSASRCGAIEFLELAPIDGFYFESIAIPDWYYQNKTIQQINQELSDYTDKNCLNCYARLLDDGRVHLDNKFKISDLKAILNIIEGKNENIHSKTV